MLIHEYIETDPGCPNGQRKCKNNACIPSIKFCDFVRDCTDGSDETGCPNSCNFDTDMCGWNSPLEYGEIQWARNSGGTPSSFTGPTTDHTTGTGHYFMAFIKIICCTLYLITPFFIPIYQLTFILMIYLIGYYMYVEADNGTFSSDAYLVSPIYNNPGSTCTLSFWYHMYGTSIGSLSLSVVTPSGTQQIWTKSGGQGNSWKQAANLKISSCTTAFQVIK